MPLPTLIQISITLGLGFCACVAFLLFRAIYYISPFHSLDKFPGPKLWSACRLFWVYHEFRGDLIFCIQSFHEIYGPVVRIAPDELSFTDLTAWRDIYTSNNNLKQQLPRDPYIFPPDVPNFEGGIINAGHVDHARIRKQLAYAFSTKALEEQQGLVQRYVDILVKQFHKLATASSDHHNTPGALVDFGKWMNLTTVDIMGELSYGDSFACLEDGDYHPYTAFIMDAFVASTFASALNRYGLLPLAFKLMPKELVRKQHTYVNMGIAMVDRRLQEHKDGTDEGKSDFFAHMLKEKEEGVVPLTYQEMVINAFGFMVAGSESTATLLSGTMWYLLKHNPQAMARLTADVRGAFKTEQDIDMASASKLPYLLACLEEGHRLAVPAPFSVARRTPADMTIAGVQVPKNTSVGIPQYAAWHDARNFERPRDYIPERWLESGTDELSEFIGGERKGFVPFSIGPRSCLGKNLAYMEMRIILARLIWNFDFELTDQSFEWTKQKAYLVWQKDPLMVRIKSAR